MTGHDLQLIREFLDMPSSAMAGNLGVSYGRYRQAERVGAGRIWGNKPDRVARVWRLVDIKQGVAR